MTIEEALKVWRDSIGFNEIECGRDLQKSITVAFRSLEAWGKVKEDLIQYSQCKNTEDYSDAICDALKIINKHLSEVEK